MQSRTSTSTASGGLSLLPSASTALSIEENGFLLGSDAHNNQGNHPNGNSSSNNHVHLAARDWPFKLSKLLFAFILLGTGLILGFVFTLHVSHYVSPTSIHDSMDTLCRKTTRAPTEIEMRGLSGPSLPHNISDPELLWLASMAPQRNEMPIKRIPKVAFLFLTRGPLHLSPIWERFFEGNDGLFSVYVHTDPRFKLDVPHSSVFYRRQIPSQVTKWGDISMIDAERRLLANALLDYANERFVLLSEACIPLQPFRTVYNHLIFSNTSFLGSFDDPGPYGRGRYNWNMGPLVSLQQWRKGSQWFELNRRLSVYAVSDTAYYAKFKDFCKPACYVDEHYLPTMLAIEFAPEIANKSVTWVDWSRGGAHPAMFGKDDITKSFIARIREDKSCIHNGQPGAICFLFARKFAPNAVGPLLEMASEIIGV